MGVVVRERDSEVSEEVVQDRVDLIRDKIREQR